MTLLAVERIKLLSTRSPWWCALVTLVVTIGFAAVITGFTERAGLLSVATTEFGYTFGLAVVMVLAALTVTTEYRFGTIRTTFTAIPNRTAALLSKTVVVALLALVLGELAGFGSWALGSLLAPEADLALDTAGKWINVAGIGPVYALAAVIAVAVGILIRHSAGAIALLLIYTLAGEGLVSLIPKVGEQIHQWMPFVVADKFVTGSGSGVTQGPPASDAVLSQAWALPYFAGIAVLLLAVAIGVANRRDA